MNRALSNNSVVSHPASLPSSAILQTSLKLRNPWPHRLAVVLAISTLGLIFMGGLVTSTGSGLAVPDWPLSYGRLMPPMVGGIFFEHSHRLAAATVGFFTVLLAIFFSFKEDRPWVKGAAWAAVGLVILQGLFGGLTVLFQLPPPLSVVHAFLAQSFFCLTVSLAVWTSPFWASAPRRASESAGKIALDQLYLGLFLVLLVQLLLGAVLRHTGWGIIPHIVGAGIFFLLAGYLLWRVISLNPKYQVFSVHGGVLFGGVGAQIFLGVASFLFLAYGINLFPGLRAPIWVRTGHVVVGAFLLGWTWMGFLMAYRTKGQSTKRTRRLADFFELTKPGISVMAGVTALTGFILGSQGQIQFWLLCHTVVGTFLVSAGACTLNMVFEKDVDSQMRRTHQRPLPAGRLKFGEALLFGGILSVFGIVYLSTLVNGLTAFLAGLTLCVYLYLYTPLKKVSAFCTAVGAVAGALPPVMGWTAASGSLGRDGWILFGILFFWQFPHFLSLAWLYQEDYQRAGLNMLPSVEASGRTTAFQITFFTSLLLGVSLLPSLLGDFGPIYFGMALVLGIILFLLGISFQKNRSPRQARRVFLASVVYLPLLLGSLILSRLPQIL